MMKLAPLPNIKIPQSNSALFATRREILAKRIREKSGSGVAIISTAPEVFRNRDSDFPYRHDSDFYYLTGFTEPEAVLVIQVTSSGHVAHLFCRPKNLEREIWDGKRLGPDAAPAALSVNFAHSIDNINTVAPDLIANQSDIYYRLASSGAMDEQVRTWMSSLASRARAGVKKPSHAHNIENLVHEMRLFKDAFEIDTMRASGKIAALGHIKAMQTSQIGLREYHLEAELLHTFRYHGAQSVAYNSIVATGANACILHYRASDAQLKDGDLCLIDAGCELNSYASDITRTFPVNGKFSAAQKQAYEVVLAAQEAAIAATLPGKHFQEAHEAAVRVLTEGLFEMKVLNLHDHGTLENAIEKQAYAPYYMHRTGHWLGMDVHDVGEYREPLDSNNGWRILREGMMTTIEPGLYFRPSKEVPEAFWNIGIRIEDDALLTASGCELLTRDVPVSISEIEAVMRSSK
jgi:Xaa-Pro aminopeptidase